ncbi:hypothetical protein PHYSODRAFT_343066 [Phytophthora sojae]|uniref:Uncharacterized protein n=1 Tax=Phytophthora sojae (strain P6497) TaxID=1094619 RepID=G5AII4_PHYSP|nr:hypothetical protein PHYSODRAFT_343066 [Phytophthora sojae]EGZ04685.1 hypothetical protein PHYSODRAFT_343066 [Phytophthora sojae]|eukprot:XP_009539885.1 hypothetical protein PHYSODRAFT_343066 [Phytophthora sojae]
MNGSMSSLTATITSALALKAFTFCELREKLLALIDDEMATYLTSPDMDNIESSFNTRSNVSLSASASSSSTLRDGATRGAATRWLPNSRNVSMWVIMLKANGDELALANDFDDLQSMLQEAVERQRSRLNHTLGA